LGEYHKPEVRILAQELGLPVAERPDSQDLCFVGGNGDYRQFLARHTPNIIQPGLIVDLNGNCIGTHSGLANYTIGQRKGINVSSPIPRYVLRKDQSTNTLVVGDRQLSASDFLIAENVNWIENQLPKFPLFALVKIRYKSHEILCTVNLHQGESIKVDFTQPVHDITPGQAAVYIMVMSALVVESLPSNKTILA
jgi:tRNA-specific 2-thiouridylase